ncbi:MAG: Hpt domain-containing protein [Leptolyngbya sp. SIO4C5]|nr:Hpt domain-containing protein [Leptolyngbya sp. SIO4C5]
MSSFSAESSPIDLEQLQQISGNDPEFEQELLQLFVEDAIAQTEILATAIAQQNGRDIEETAHHIKGSSANVGAVSISQTAAQIEQIAYQQDVAQQQSLLATLKQALSEVRHYLDSLGG